MVNDPIKDALESQSNMMEQVVNVINTQHDVLNTQRDMLNTQREVNKELESGLKAVAAALQSAGAEINDLRERLDRLEAGTSEGQNLRDAGNPDSQTTQLRGMVEQNQQSGQAEHPSSAFMESSPNLDEEAAMTEEDEDLGDHITQNVSFYDLTKDVVEKIDAIEEIQLTPEELEKVRIAVWVAMKTAKEVIEMVAQPTIVDGETDLAALTLLRDQIAYVIGRALRSQVLWRSHQGKEWKAVSLVARYLAAIHIHRSANNLLGVYDEDIEHNYKGIDEDIRALLADDRKRLLIKPFGQEE